MTKITLSGLNGGNPLAFLAALGLFRTLNEALPNQVLMNWEQCSGGWKPCIKFTQLDGNSASPYDSSNPLAIFLKSNTEDLDSDLAQWGFSDALANFLEIPSKAVLDAIIDEVVQLEKKYRKAKKEIFEKEKKLKNEAKEKKIKKAELNKFLSENIDYESVNQLRQEWLIKLQTTVYSPELGLGKTLSVTPEEMRDMMRGVANECSTDNRLVADLLTAFGNEVCEKDGLIEYTPFCFVTGSGHQYFLQFIQKLLSSVSNEHIYKTLFKTWTYEDTGLSLRWDPIDDRRYALMWTDPTASGNETQTMWAANLFGYRGLSLLPSFAVGKSLKTTGFINNNQVFTWPLWETPIPFDTVKSLLSMEVLGKRPLNRANREIMAAIGIKEIYESTRIQVGNPPLVKINFSLPSAV